MSKKFETLSRRNFLALGGGILGTLSAACGTKEPAKETAAEAMSKTLDAEATEYPQDIPFAGFRVGVQSYCFREFKTREVLIESLHSLGLAHIEIWPDGHLPVDTPEAEIEAAVKQFFDQGLTIDACGVVDFPNDEAQCRKIFEYAKKLGVIAISAGPVHEALPLMVKLTAEYGLPIAIHNHGPQDTLFGTSALIRQYLAPLPASVGLCVDTGHFQRVGEDPLAVITEFADRVHGVHLKDMVKGANGEWEDRIVGKGNLDLPALMKKLKEIGFKGYFSLEYESDPGDPLPAMRQCLQELRNACQELA